MAFWKSGRTKTISTTVPEELYKDAKNRHWKHNDLWMLGYQIKSKNPVLDRVKELEEREKRRAQDYLILRKRYIALEEELKKIKRR